MNPLIKLIQINHSFQKSVNLQLDLDNYERIGSYIPTRSSIAILKRYWNIVSGKSGESASVLIGPYGKGKSHLLLVLLALLHGSMERDQVILGKIEKIDPQLTEEIRQWIKQGNKYLPVLVNSVSGTDLNQSFIYALQQALNREGLQNLAPADYYSMFLYLESIILNKDEERYWMTGGNMGMLPIRIILEIYQYVMEHPEL